MSLNMQFIMYIYTTHSTNQARSGDEQATGELKKKQPIAAMHRNIARKVTVCGKGCQHYADIILRIIGRHEHWALHNIVVNKNYL